MYFAPHTLELFVESPIVEDENGDPISQPQSEWRKIGMCRCDDAGNQTLYGENGIAYNPLYKIVFNKGILLKKGMTVRALRADGSVRGEGKIDRAVECNYLNYQAVWLI